MSLPPYEPDGSLPEVISDDLSPKELVERYGVSKQTLYTRLAALGITPHRHGKSSHFDRSMVYQLDAAHFYLSKGYGLKDLKSASVEFNTKNIQDVDSIPSPTSQNDVTELVIAPQQERVVMALTASIREALQSTTPPPPRDPLLAYRQLQEATDMKYQLTSQSLREILGVAQSTINSWSSVVSRNGFTLKKVGAGKWRVFREDDEKVA
jgi:hypothetical protein|tara:strand:- start:114 stop:740 length:627 start_codon:yes stop_codon:yes gene_type:complete